MTDNEINVAIAEHLGWRKEPSPFDPSDICWINPEGDIVGQARFNLIPKFCSDLNAMHEAEKLTPNDADYANCLGTVVCGDGFDQYDQWHWVSVVSATARQRAEAFLVAWEMARTYKKIG